MSTPSLTSNPARSGPLSIHVFGHPSAHPEAIAELFGGVVRQHAGEHCDLAVFVIDPALGIDGTTIENWEVLNDSMPARLVIVTGIENQDADFDDAVLLANRVFDLMVTPYLVLHDDQGLPCALISLSDLKIHDFSTTPPTITESDPEHKTLVSEFRSEYLAAMDVMGENGFAAGLLFPAIPIWIEKGIGVAIVQSFITLLK